MIGALTSIVFGFHALELECHAACVYEKKTVSACVVLSQLFSLVLDTPYRVRLAEKM